MTLFVAVHFDDGCAIGLNIEESETTITVEFDNCIILDIPKERVSNWV